MTTNNELAAAFRANTGALNNLLDGFDESTFHQKPPDGGWSAGEVAEHILIFDRHLNKVLNSATVPVYRDPYEKVAAYSERVTNRDVKLHAPPFLLPSGDAVLLKKMKEDIGAEREKLLQAIEQRDLSLSSVEFPHRLFGEMTAQEWIRFIIMHTERHLPQLQALSGNSPGR